MSTKSDHGDVYSIAVRVQRTTVECAYILVPLTRDLTGAERGLDGSRVFARAIELSESGLVRWYPEEQTTKQHHIQKARNEGEVAFSPIDIVGTSAYKGNTLTPVLRPESRFQISRRELESAHDEQIRTRITHTMSVLPCSDIDATTQFYVDRLGFQSFETTDAEPVLLGVVRDSLYLQFDPLLGGADRAVEPREVTAWVTDLAMLAEEFRVRQVPFSTATAAHSDARPCVDVRDLDGHLLRFIQT